MATGGRSGAGRRVGELATATGLTVRTLHYYEEIGLLKASGRSDAGRHLRVFGLGPGELTRYEGKVVHGEIQAGDGVVWLHPEAPEFRLASPKTLGAATATMAVMVDDVDAHFRHALEQGAAIDYEPVDQPYGYREYSARDSEGGLWSFMKPLD